MGKSRSGRYVLTTRRRNALHKAQLASARKRRSQRNKRVAAGVAVGAGILAVAAGSHYVRNLSKGGPKRPTGPQALTRGYTVTNLDKHKPKKTKKPSTWRTYSKSGKPKIIAVSPTGVATITRFNAEKSKARKQYDFDRKRDYWRSKPVGGAPRKNARKSPQERMVIKAQQRVDNAIKQGKIKNVKSLDVHRRSRKKR